MRDPHTQVIHLFLARLVIWTLAFVTAIGAIGALYWAVYTYNIPQTMVVPIFFFVGCVVIAVWWLWHDSKRKVMDEHKRINK